MDTFGTLYIRVTVAVESHNHRRPRRVNLAAICCNRSEASVKLREWVEMNPRYRDLVHATFEAAHETVYLDD